MFSDDDNPPAVNEPEVTDTPEEAQGLMNRILRWIYPAYDDEYEEDNYAASHADNPREETQIGK